MPPRPLVTEAVNPVADEPLDIVGVSWPRADARDKVRGHAIYLEDLAFKGMLFGRVLRSRHPHARLLRVDASRAAAVPGVVAVVTGADLPFIHGESLVDEPFLARDKVRHVGEAVAAVAADSLAAADEALALIEVEYEPLPAVFDVEEAVQPGAVLVHETLGSYAHPPGITPIPGTNICNHFEMTRGDVAQGFAEADLLFEDTFSTPMQQHCSIEPHGAICVVNDDGRVTLWTNNDSPYRCRKELAESFKVPFGNVRVISAPNIGGNFGGKGGLKAEACAMALAWKARNRPVRVVYTRDEEFRASIGRHPSRTWIKTGVKHDGTIVAREVRIYLDSGAYAEKGPTVARFCGVSAAGPYKIPHVKVDVYCVYTNKAVAGAMRGYGGPQGAWAYESQMDIIARRLGIDPLEYRLRHAYEDGDEHITGQVLESEGLKDCLRSVADAMDWQRAPKPPGVGRGIACMERAVKTPFGSAAFVKVNEDGTVDILSSTTEVGQGADTALSQIVAQELGVPLEAVRRAPPDTAYTPFDASTTSSRSTFHMGNAVRLAAADARAQICAIAAEQLEVPATELHVSGGVVTCDVRPGWTATIGAVLRRRYGPCATVLGRGYYWPDMPDQAAEYYSRFVIHWLLGAAGAEVYVNATTGRVTVLKLWGAFDAGKAINPRSCEGMIQGGMTMGLGFALGEELAFRDGEALNPTLLTYKVPTAVDTPEIVPLIVEHPHPDGPFGAKGMGETTNVPVPPAIANAIHDAIGVRIHHLPITPDKILEALKRNVRREPGQDA